jgi:NAD(P)-dependent dehydrogenase (short-subunit alcohol dehydrogenase family)
VASRLEESWPDAIEATERRFGQLGVMVANAGIGILCSAIEMSLADWRRQTAVNLDGVSLSVKSAFQRCAALAADLRRRVRLGSGTGGRIRFAPVPSQQTLGPSM